MSCNTPNRSGQPPFQNGLFYSSRLVLFSSLIVALIVPRAFIFYSNHQFSSFRGRRNSCMYALQLFYSVTRHDQSGWTITLDNRLLHILNPERDIPARELHYGPMLSICEEGNII
jgi:hypothetical protein